MAREITPEDWPARVADAEIIGVVGAPAFGRGRRYAEQGRVANLSVSGNGEILAAAVRGAQGRVYQTMVFARISGQRVRWSGTCSCPVGGNCKHTAALVLTARGQAQSASAPAGDIDWERRLNQLLRTRRTAYRAVALEVADTATAPGRTGRFGASSARPGRLHLRPLIAGKRGWVKQGISWRGLTTGELTGEVAPDVLSALADLASMDPYGDYYYSNAVIDLGALPTRVWDALRRAVAAGVTLTTAQHAGHEVRILPGLRAGVGVNRQADGTALVAAALDIDAVEGLMLGAESASAPRPLGNPVHAYALTGGDGALNLMPLEPPPDEVLGRLLAHNEQITVPAADVGRFEREHLGRLAAAVPIVDLDPTLNVPDVGAPAAVLRIELDAAAHRAETSWSIRYLTSSGDNRGEAELGSLTELLNGPAPPSWGRVLGTAAQAGTSTGFQPHTAAITEPGPAHSAKSAPVARDARAEDRLARSIVEACMPLVPTHGPLWQRGVFTGMSTARLVSQALPALEAVDGVVVEVEGRVPDYREAEDAPLITTDVADDDDRPDWFSLRVRVKVGEEDVPVERLMTAVAQGADEVLLDSGQWISLADRPEITRLARLMEEGRDLRDPHARSAGDLAVTAFQAGLYAELEQLGVIGEAARRWREGVERLLAVAAAAEDGAGSGPAGGDRAGTADAGGACGAPSVVDAPAPAGLRAELRPYQLDGYRWLALLQSTGLGGILADDMGLGKTIQVLAVVQRMAEQRAAGVDAAHNGAEVGEAAQPGAFDGPVLVVAPTSVVGAWAEQAARFCPDLRVRTITRTRAKRDENLEEIRSGADLVVTSYTIARIEEEDFTAVDWSWVVLDEAQFVKNHNAVTYKTMRRLHTPSTVAITGTPLENSLMDLWSLLSITAPGLLPGPERFAELYRRPVEHGDESALAALRARIRPFMLRRTKEAVAADLPAKNEQVMTVELAPAHRRAYDRRLARERQKVLGLLEEDTAQSRFTALKSLTTLRQMALDPALVEESEAAGSGKSAQRRKPGAKVEVLLDTLQPVVAEGHKALVFSQFTRYLRGVRDALEAAGMRTTYLEGATGDRQEAIDAFRSGEAEVFLISLKAGGFGLTLTEADYVFLLDPWWNPQAEEQAVDRAHRIGQDKPVMVYRLVSAGTIEEKVMTLKEKKADLFERVVEGAADAADAAADGAAARAGATPSSRARLTAQEIRELLGGE
ncbi:helicase [Actinomyces sp. 432]|uniref:DEAD/DEAH box helicase n=1 Tax=Actinomyces sp. 432 TaxID=2057798 RepID=UPI00137399F8|nr:DEAD/DEAH box helicase [Actinomyces sp. 432]QHO90484.1 helicase [Actinomyces sp. 432]